VDRYPGWCQQIFPGFTNYTTSNGLAHNTVNAITQDASGAMWFGTANGASKFSGSTWTTYTTVHGLSSNVVTDILADTRGNLWFASYTPNGGITKYDGTSWPLTEKNTGLSITTQTSLPRIPGSNMIGTGNGISKLQPESWGITACYTDFRQCSLWYSDRYWGKQMVCYQQWTKQI